MKKREWKFVYSEGHSLVMNEAFFRAFTEVSGVPGIFNTILYINRGGLEICYVPAEELQRVREEGRRFFKSSYRIKFTHDIEKRASHFKHFYGRIRRLSIERMSNARLARIFQGYLDCLIPFLARYQVSGGRVYPLLEEKIKEAFKTRFQGQEADEKYGTMLMPNTLDTLEREEIDLRRLAHKSRLTDATLRRHAKKYSNRYLMVYDEQKIFDYLRQRIRELGRQSAQEYRAILLKRKRAVKEEQRRIAPAFGKGSEVLQLAEFIREQGRLRFEYKEWFFGAEYKFLELFLEIAGRIDIDVEEFFLTYTIEDIFAFLKGGKKVPPEERKARRDVYVLICDEGKRQFFAGKAAQETVHALMGASDTASTLVGTGASRGKAVGRARVILPRDFVQMEEELRHFESGEILVTTMTQPQLVRVMKKAAAIVTDQGGMTSHAAVISREFKLPCVVGTYNATRILKTGDMVEVDANTGVVKIIKRA